MSWKRFPFLLFSERDSVELTVFLLCLVEFTTEIIWACSLLFWRISISSLSFGSFDLTGNSSVHMNLELVTVFSDYPFKVWKAVVISPLSLLVLLICIFSISLVSHLEAYQFY